MTEEAYIKRLVKLETKLKDARHEMACLALGIPASLDGRTGASGPFTVPDNTQATTAIHRAARAVNTIIWHATKGKGIQ